MRNLWTVISAVLILHMLAVVGLAGWLHMTGRLNQQRIEKAAAVFAITIAEEEAQQKKAEEAAAAQDAIAQEEARVEALGDGPKSVKDQLNARLEADEAAMIRAERVREEIRQLQGQLATARRLLAAERTAIDEQRELLDARIKAQQEKLADADFQQALKMFESVSPKQAKEIFQSMLQAGQRDEVVEYLASMNTRMAGDVLKQFKTPEEIEQAKDLIQGLRNRGSRLTGPPAPRADAGAAANGL